jgi:type II secretory pathway component PulF
MKFHYVAFQADGKLVEGNMDADTTSAVLSALAARNLKPMSVKPADGKAGGVRKRIFGSKITVSDKIFITKYLSLMLKVGTDLFKAIDILVTDFDKPAVKEFMVEIRESLERGEPFYSTFARYPKSFSPVFVNLIKAGESSGNLEHVLEDLNESLQKEKELKGKVKAALIYPILLVGVASVIVLFLVTFALPKIADIFSGGGFEPPLFSRIVFAVGLFLNEYIAIILSVGAVFLAGMSFFFFKTQGGRRIGSRALNAIPVIGTIRHRIALQRFSSTLSSLLKSGIPIVSAIEITADAVAEEGVSSALRRISGEGISKGLTLGESFKKEPVFPSVVSNLMAVSEKAGHLDDILKTLGTFYEAEIDSAIKTLIAFIEPVLLLGIGLTVGVIALSIIVPIYQLVGQF